MLRPVEEYSSGGKSKYPAPRRNDLFLFQVHVTGTSGPERKSLKMLSERQFRDSRT